MKCPICEKGSLSKKTVDGLRHGLFIGHFKALVCGSCGEQIFDEAEGRKIEKKIKEMGLWGRQESTIYKVGGNLALGIKKALADSLGLTKGKKVRVIPQISQKRFIVEVS
ncbi:MAG: YgiT-type zinc finger protein [Candidatus Micrarchaeota archaeon]